MDKLKFWGVAVGFIVFLWLLSPDPEEQSPNFLLDNVATNTGVKVLDDPLNAPEPMKFKTGKVTVTTRRGNLPLVLGFAYTPQQHRAGLMHYRVWPRNMHGLLFLFKEEDEYSMWMRNTHLSLDIAFIDRNGYIVQIARGTQPHSEAPIRAKKPVLAIMEIPAGSADKWKLQIGDRFRLKYFRSALPSQ